MIKGNKINFPVVLMLGIFGVLFLYLPWGMNQNAMRGVLVMMLTYTIFILKDRSWLLMLPLIYFLIPQQLNNNVSNTDIMKYSKDFSYFNSLVVITFLVLEMKTINVRQKRYGLPLACALFMLILSLFYYKYSAKLYDVYAVFYFIVLYYIFYIVVKNTKASYMFFYYAMDVLFYVLSFFALLEVFMHESPYNYLYYAYMRGDLYDIDFFRVKSLCGHPLLFVAFLVIYQITLYARIIMKKSKIVFLNFLLLILVSLLTLSRTAFVIIMAIFVLYLWLSIKNSHKKIKSAFFAVIAASLIIYLLFNDLIILSMERFSYSETSESNRLAAFQVAGVIFTHEPFGVGESLNEIYKVYHRFFSRDFTVNVIDNAFLSLLCKYGVFVPFFIVPLIYPIIDVYKIVKDDDNCRILFWITVASFCLLSFSFMINCYISIMMLMAVSFAIISIIHNSTINKE